MTWQNPPKGIRPRFALPAILIAVAGCTVGPNYRRPEVTPPAAFRGDETPTAGADAPSLGDAQWTAVFQDDALQTLITTALERNYDLRIAAVRVMEAEAQLGITRSDQFPIVTGEANVQGQRTLTTGGGGDQVRTFGAGQFGLFASWAPDFWGRYRRATEAARAEMLASEWGRRAVMTTLVSEVSTSYFALRSLDAELEISQRTLASRQESLRLTEVRERGGATSLVDVRQAEQLVFSAQAQIVDLQRRIEQEENGLSVLLGRNPGPIDRGRALTEQPHAPDVPAGLPSALLARRPDIAAAEQQLVAATAQIGVARSFYFPQISLTGSGGIASTALSGLVSAGTWAVGAGAAQPLFTAGRTRSQVAVAEARRTEAELAYQRTIQQAFREVSDALVAYRRTREFRGTQEGLVRAAQDARRLAELRYQGGASSYLEVLDSDTRLFSAELGLAQAQLDELAAFVEIYRSLGGGWTS